MKKPAVFGTSRAWMTALVLAVSSGCGSGEGDLALTAGSCPGAPRNLVLEESAPYWWGLVTLGFDVPGGVPGGTSVEIFDSSLGVWESAFPTVGQRPDGRYVARVRPNVSSHNKDEPRMLRVRSTLVGCPMTEWAESEPFTLSNPFANTTWAADLNESGGDWDSLSIQPQLVDAEASYTGRYAIDLDSTFRHQMEFKEDGVLTETFEYRIVSETAGDAYDGCSFVLTYEGKWEVRFRAADGAALLITDRTPAGDGTAGSSCDSPAVGDMRIGTEAAVLRDLSLNLFASTVDYTGALLDPASPATLSQYELNGALTDTIQHLSVVGGSEPTTVQWVGGTETQTYKKQ